MESEDHRPVRREAPVELPFFQAHPVADTASEVEVAQVVPQAAPGGQQMVTLLQAAEQVSQTVMLGHGPEAAPAIVDLLEELGVLK